MIDFWPVCGSQHETNATTIEEGHVGRRLKKKCHPQHIAIERKRAIKILNVDEDLPDLRQSRANRNWAAQVESPLEVGRASM